MKARVKATGEIVEVNKVTSYNKNLKAIVYYKAENGFPYKEEHLDFECLELDIVDVKEKSFPKDEPDYWEKLKHQYAGMVMAGMISADFEGTYKRIAEDAIEAATALVEKLKNEK